MAPLKPLEHPKHYDIEGFKEGPQLRPKYAEKRDFLGRPMKRIAMSVSMATATQ